MEKLEEYYRIIKIYEQAFKEAMPSADFGKMIESGEVKKERFFMEYYLPDDRLEEIVKEHCKNLNEHEMKVILNTVMLGCAPNGNKENWERARKLSDKEVIE